MFEKTFFYYFIRNIYMPIKWQHTNGKASGNPSIQWNMGRNSIKPEIKFMHPKNLLRRLWLLSGFPLKFHWRSQIRFAALTDKGVRGGEQRVPVKLTPLISFFAVLYTQMMTMIVALIDGNPLDLGFLALLLHIKYNIYLHESRRLPQTSTKLSGCQWNRCK